MRRSLILTFLIMTLRTAIDLYPNFQKLPLTSKIPGYVPDIAIESNHHQVRKDITVTREALSEFSVPQFFKPKIKSFIAIG